MRCKKHYTDLGSTVGVCACCLRERLLSVIAAQQQLEAQAQAQAQIQPRSVSPYIHSRTWNQSDNICRNDRPRHRHTVSEQLFYKTPEIEPDSTSGVEPTKKRSFIRFLSFQYIFRSRNRKTVDSVDATLSPSWFSTVVRGRRRRKQPVCVDKSTVTTGGPVRRPYCRDRGMSPVRNSDAADVDEDVDEFESAGSWKNTPRRTPARGGGGHRRNLSGFKYCLSPLVRASPNRQWNQKGMQPDGVLSGEIRVPVKPHLSVTKAYCANRSRKIADFGRPNQNR
ncbi:uncharacterized protein LOC143625029 [Bidens hawaiensis]|uniref:uncharacterized protein LOC143625029 n=1 Tax=Bidens hawaiensis TaxID=980011 RepID=UPI004049CB85